MEEKKEGESQASVYLLLLMQKHSSNFKGKKSLLCVIMAWDTDLSCCKFYGPTKKNRKLKYYSHLFVKIPGR